MKDYLVSMNPKDEAGDDVGDVLAAEAFSLLNSHIQISSSKRSKITSCSRINAGYAAIRSVLRDVTRMLCQVGVEITSGNHSRECRANATAGNECETESGPASRFNPCGMRRRRTVTGTIYNRRLRTMQSAEVRRGAVIAAPEVAVTGRRQPGCYGDRR